MPEETRTFEETILSFFDSRPHTYSFRDTWESIWLPEGYEKPSKEEFEAKLQELIDAQPWNELREERNKRLSQCDWVTLKAYSTGVPVPEEWKTYMQALRDLPANTDDPSNVTWPQEPTD